MMEYKVAAVTDVGNVRETNEDSLLVCRKLFNKKEALLAVVADGMGGLSHGEWASQFLTKSLQEWWTEVILPIEKELDIEMVKDMIGFVIDKIHKGILVQMETCGAKMGTTLSLLFLYDKEYFIYQIGDSRVYLIFGRQITQLTKDQTWCQREYDEGRLTTQEMRKSKKKHVLTNALGIKAQFYSTVTAGTVKKGQRFLICSDGYYTYLEEKELYRKLFRNNLSETLEKSVERIRKGKAEDNLSAILIEV